MNINMRIIRNLWKL